MDLPVEMLIGWSDIKEKGLMQLFMLAGEIPVPTIAEIAPEEAEWRDEFPEVFSGKLPLIPARVDDMKVRLMIPGKALLRSLPPRKFSGAVRKFINEEVTAWLESGVIVPSQASYVSQLVPVRTPGRDMRLCIDYRKVNEITVIDPFPLPDMKYASKGSGKATLCEDRLEERVLTVEFGS